MSQVIRNLMSNALKFSNENSTVTVTLAPYDADDKRPMAAKEKPDPFHLYRTSSRVGVDVEWMQLKVIDTGAGVRAVR